MERLEGAVVVKMREVASTHILAPRETVYQILTQADRVATAGTVWERAPTEGRVPGARVGVLRGSFHGVPFVQESWLTLTPLERLEVRPVAGARRGHEAWYVLTPVNNGKETRLTHGAAWGAGNLLEEVVARVRRGDLRRAVENELATIKRLAERVELPPEF